MITREDIWQALSVLYSNHQTTLEAFQARYSTPGAFEAWKHAELKEMESQVRLFELYGGYERANP